VKVTRKVVTVSGGILPELKIISGYGNDSGIIPIPLQQFFAEAEESRVRQTIILQYDSFLHFLKSPLQATGDPPLAPQVGIGVIREYFTRPIYPSFDD